ncbi:hypothetical protein C6P40_002951 [Pichia californica]|uniref:GPI transamidase component GAB1 n=1 Tax=Pichia californica TaxID=460514 RepID=A0A9P7BEW6_9ASCO|nr:hypothetical protein C6P42_002736 [[Candida] californica]KAG0687064.1 hypothetical protein C6P40_002951 [[Candida] californica]
MDISTIFVLASGTFLRFVVFIWIPNLSHVMDQFSLFATPINSYISLTEGIYLLSNGLNPYQQGEIIHHPPILLKFFAILKNFQIDDNFNTTIFYSILDLVICLQLIKINKLLNGNDGYSSLKIACFYMFNPFTILTSFAKSTYLINNLFVMSTFSALIKNQLDVSIILLSFSTYLTYYTWYLLVPICYWRYQNEKTVSSIIKSILLFISSITILFGISYKLSNNSFNFINLCYLTIIQLKKITPNLGLWWYFFTEIFDSFKYFYLSVFNLYSFILVLPLCTRFIVPNDKMKVMFVSWIIIGITNFAKPYPIFADYSLFYSSVFLFKPYFKYLKISPITMYAALFVVFLQSPSYYIVWMVLSSGNANFFYAVSLTLGLVSSVILSDFVWAFLKDEYYLKQKEINNGKEIPETSLTQI